MGTARKVATLLVPWLIAGSFAIHGQNVTSSIVGEVKDVSAAAIPGAQITVTNTDSGISHQVASGSAGTYVASDLLAAHYQVSVTAKGFETYVRTGIRLLAAQSVRVDITLRVATVLKTVNTRR